MNISTKS